MHRMHGPTSFAFLCVCWLLQGCATIAESPPTSAAGFTTTTEAPVIAVALSGGGSKAAPFALGVLEALVERGDLEEIDHVSSVSGGGYAALHLYSRAWDISSGEAHAPATLRDDFSDCLPMRYAGLPPSDTDTIVDGLPLKVCPRFKNNFVAEDPYRFQNHLRGFQNLLDYDFEYDATSLNRAGVSGSVFKHVLASVATAPAHHFANSLFDWKLRISPTGYKYDGGIERTWSRTSAKCGNKECERSPLASDPLLFSDLRTLMDRSHAEDCGATGDRTPCRLPTWHINATAANHPVRQYFVRMPYALQDVFTFSPHGYGSDSHGFEAWSDNDPLAPDVPVARAVAASAAFFDIMPPNNFSQPVRLLAAGLQHSLNLSWGHFFRNYLLTPLDYERHKRVHRLLPFPLYLLHKNNYGRKGIDIRLSDGGRAENLGAYAALRHGATDLVLVDAAEDRKAKLEDLCALREQIRLLGDRDWPVAGRRVADLELDGLRFGGRQFSLAEWCNKKSRKRALEDLAGLGLPEAELIRHWPAPVLTGCVLSEPADHRSQEPAPCTRGPGRVVIRLYLVKPAITTSATELIRSNRELAEKCLSGLAKDKALREGCHKQLVDLYVRASALLPAEVVGFMLVNRDVGLFPQHSTWRTTASSSPFIYGAYRSLARHLTGHLDIDRGERPEQPILVLEAPPNP